MIRRPPNFPLFPYTPLFRFVALGPRLSPPTLPAGLITADAYARITQELLHLLDVQGPWDGVLLALHGAAVAEGHPDADGAFVARVRACVGSAIPIGVALDLHANLTPRLVGAATVTVLYRTNPHQIG